MRRESRDLDDIVATQRWSRDRKQASPVQFVLSLVFFAFLWFSGIIPFILGGGPMGGGQDPNEVAGGMVVQAVLLGLCVAIPISAVTYLHFWRRAWNAEDDAPSTCRGVFIGPNSVSGRAVPALEPLIAPFSNRPVVWFEWVLQHLSVGAKQWATVDFRSSTAPFWLRDDTGQVLVRPRDAHVDTGVPAPYAITGHWSPRLSIRQAREWCMVGEDAEERVRSMADRSFGAAPNIVGLSTVPIDVPIGDLGERYRVIERAVMVDGELYVRGEAVARRDGYGLELRAGAQPLHLSIRSQALVAGESASLMRRAGLTCLLASGAVAFWLQHPLGVQPALATAGVVMAGEIAASIAIWCVATFNRQVKVKEQAARAWSLIEVTLARRADLLPNLVRVVEGYVEHEASLQAALAASGATARPSSKALPRTEELRDAERSDHEQASAARHILIVAEQYPDLAADQLFRDLQTKLVDAENTVSSAREHYNDAIEVLRTRRRVFPGSVIAPLVRVPSWELFEASAGARHTSEVAFPHADHAVPSTIAARDVIVDPATLPVWPPRPARPPA